MDCLNFKAEVAKLFLLVDHKMWLVSVMHMKIKSNHNPDFPLGSKVRLDHIGNQWFPVQVRSKVF